MNHALIDRRSLMMHRMIAERLRANPVLLEVARGNMARWNCPERGWWREWSGILQQPLGEIIAMLVRNDEEGCRLRQSSPFAGILSPHEVWRLKREFKKTGNMTNPGPDAAWSFGASPPSVLPAEELKIDPPIALAERQRRSVSLARGSAAAVLPREDDAESPNPNAVPSSCVPSANDGTALRFKEIPGDTRGRRSFLAPTPGYGDGTPLAFVKARRLAPPPIPPARLPSPPLLPFPSLLPPAPHATL